MKLFVDDMRACPEGWEVARTITAAIRILATQDVDEVSLDHDIADPNTKRRSGFSEETFEPVARYIALMRETDTCYREDQRLKVRIHTSNVAAGRRMADILGIPYNNEIFDPRDYR